jgi:hypothetical protein
MRKLTFEKLYIFSPLDETARVIEFAKGKTMITSSAIDGTDRGKSVIMKSLYHTMGADCDFDDKWDDDSKVYVLNFSIGEDIYYIYRQSRLFKVFDAEKKILFKTTSRSDLAANLNDIFKFAVKLPARPKKNDSQEESVEKLEITPPSYNYLLYFIDQDGQKGSQFCSFQKLAQYPDFKKNTLYYHLGAFDDEYYDLKIQQEKLLENQKSCIHETNMAQMMLDKVHERLNSVLY